MIGNLENDACIACSSFETYRHSRAISPAGFRPLIPNSPLSVRGSRQCDEVAPLALAREHTPVSE